MEKIRLHHKAPVVRNFLICRDHYLLTLQETDIARETEPGQFVNLRIEGREDLFLRRPFSVARVRPRESQFDIVYRVVGKGTKAMADLRPGETVDLIGPLGTGFHLPEASGRCLLVGGGCGVAPLWALAERLSFSQNKMIALLGFRSLDRVFGEEVFHASGAEVIVTTDDGSYGRKGLLSDYLPELLGNQIDRVYVCGPPLMLKAVIPAIHKANLKGEVSLEEHMGCGFGVCLSCVVDLEREGVVKKERVCREGPVFSLDHIFPKYET